MTTEISPAQKIEKEKRRGKIVKAEAKVEVVKENSILFSR